LHPHLLLGHFFQILAAKIVELFNDAEKARDMARRAREQVVATRDMAVLTRQLVESYRAVLRSKRRS
jgi:hypothetical protein